MKLFSCFSTKHVLGTQKHFVKAFFFFYFNIVYPQHRFLWKNMQIHLSRYPYLEVYPFMVIKDKIKCHTKMDCYFSCADSQMPDYCMIDWMRGWNGNMVVHMFLKATRGCSALLMMLTSRR